MHNPSLPSISKPSSIIYPGTFDPITNGHIDIAKRALHLFDHVIIAIASSSHSKRPTFTASERVELAKKSLALLSPRLTVCSFEGLLVDFARAQNVFTILRGLRALSDYEYELQLAGFYQKLEAKIETVCLMPSEQYSYISASMIREIASLGGDVSPFVPPEVARALQQKQRESSSHNA